ncbi:MAG: thioredoxin family protein [Chloroflexi bacterium]|nr:thioredoxin family protein [Chloroflexota bacterium]
MLQIKILGPSCANCLKLEVLAMETLKELGVRDAAVEKIAAPREMERYLTGDPPGLVINEQLVWSGGKPLPTKTQITEWIRQVTAISA